MSIRSLPAPAQGTPLKSSWAPVVLFLVIAWSLVGALGMPVLFLFMRVQGFDFGSDWWAGLSPVAQVVWLLHCGTCGLCAWLLMRRSQLALWPAAALAAWHVGVVTWQALHGTLASSRMPSARWSGFVATLLVLVAVVWLRRQRVLR